MTIHHATQKKAEKLNIEIIDQGDAAEPERRYAATPDIDGYQRSFMHRDPKTAVQAAVLARQLHLEYPALRLDQTQDTNARFILTHADCDGKSILESGAVPSLSDCIEATEAEGLDPEANNDTDDAEEENKGGTVVSPRYRAAYKERGDPNNCGDWLALQLKNRFTMIVDSKETFDPEAFIAFLRENEVDITGKWAELPTYNSPGWQGRFRMNGRQKLEKVVAHRGTIVIGGETHDVPAEELKRLRAKHPEPKKRRKAQTQEAQNAETA